MGHEDHLKLIENINRNVLDSGTNTVSLVNYLFEYIKEMEKDRL